MTTSRWSPSLPALALLLALTATLPAAAQSDSKQRRGKKQGPTCGPLVEPIEAEEQAWLEEVELLMSADERDAFLCLERKYQRDAFVVEFWKTRDPYPDTARNELRERWQAQVLEARQLYGGLDDVRAQFYLLQGPPPMQVPICQPESATQIEAWYYGFANMAEVQEAIYRRRIRRGQYAVLFHKVTRGAAWRVWYPGDRLADFGSPGQVSGGLGAGCERQALEDAISLIALIQQQGGALGFAYEQLIARKLEPPPPVSEEWLLTFESYSTDLPEGAPRLAATLEPSFPGRKGQRTLVQVVATVNLATAEVGEVLGKKVYSFELIGEVLRDESMALSDATRIGALDPDVELFEKFRYRFEVAPEDVPEDSTESGAERTMPLVFQRYLRPGTYGLLVRIDDLNGPAGFRGQIDLAVPSVDELPPWEDQELAPIFAQANRLLKNGEPSVQIIEPPESELKSGYLRFDVATTGDIDKVVFALDERPILTKTKPPFSVDLDLGKLPTSQTLRVTAFDDGGEQIASDSLFINGSPYRFDVRLSDPVPGETYRHGVRAQAQVTVPDNEALERVEFYRNDDLVATLYQEPLVQVIELADPPQLTVIRAVAVLASGDRDEDAMIINGPANLEEVNVDFVELYTTVTDSERRPLLDLVENDFRVLEDGISQTIARFERVENTPIRGVVLLDISASMEERLGQTVEAAARFLQQVVTERDQLAVATFNDRPQMVSSFTHDMAELGEALLGLRAERGTALYDSLIFTLHHLNGLPGQRVLVLLSDGLDEQSRFRFEDALEYAKRSQAAVYSIGLALPNKVKKNDRGENPRKVLTQIAEETGGQAYFVDDVAGLASIYDEIARELRAKYLISYQSSNSTSSDEFRTVSVEVAQKGATARTIRGYYP